jgi:hypothetical protein
LDEKFVLGIVVHYHTVPTGQLWEPGQTRGLL